MRILFELLFFVVMVLCCYKAITFLYREEVKENKSEKEEKK